MDRVTRNKFWAIVLVALMGYVIAALIVPGYYLMAVLNGVFWGVTGGFIFAFKELLWNMAFNRDAFEDWRLLFMGIMTGGLAFLILFGNSILYLTAGMEPWSATVHSGAFARYLAILAAIAIILSPGFHRGYFQGRDKATVWASVIFGLAIAAISVFLQVTAQGVAL